MRFAVVLLITVFVNACFSEQRVSVWVTNATANDVLVRYEQSAGDRVYEVGAGQSGYLGSFPGPESRNRIAILAIDCSRKHEPVDVPPSGPVAVHITDGSVTASPIPTPEAFDPPTFPEVARCGSSREG